MIPTLSFDLEIQRGHKLIRAAAELDRASTGLLGPSGCGKTTLLHCIAGLITPVRGTLKIGESVLFDSSAGIDIAPEQRKVAVVFQDGRLFPHWSVKKNVEVGASSTDAALIAETVELLEIGNLMARMPDTLSGGEMQRVALARAIVMKPRWLLLDEPLGGVDNRLKNRILPLLGKIRDHSGIPILHVSHDVSELMSISSQLMCMTDDRLIGPTSYLNLLLDGPPGEVEAINLLPGQVVQSSGGDCQIRCGSLDLISTASGLQEKEPVTVRIAPSEVALSTGTLGNISIRNQIEGVVRKLHRYGAAYLIEVEAEQTILAECTAASCRSLSLEEGRAVTVLIKASAVHTHHPDLMPAPP